MVGRKVVAAVGLSSLFALGLYARADERMITSVFLDDQPTTTPVTPAPKPLEEGLTHWKLDQEHTGVNVYGFVEGSYTYSFSNPPGDFISGRVFDIDNQELLLNQLDLTVERTVDYAAGAKENKYTWGGKIEGIYGNDARFIHANGLNFYGSGFPQLSPDNQVDLVQAYVDIGIPVGNGLMIRAGKMVTHMGYETINPTTNPFYSHSFLFGYAIPFTHTGVMAFYNLNDKTTIMGGFSRGWDQSLEDNNDDLDYMGQVKYVFTDKITGYFNFVTGPEQTGNNSLWRTVFDGILTYQVTEKMSVAANADFGFEPGASPTGAAAQWYGLALYGGYKFNDYFSANVRGEWFEDPQGARGLGGNWYEFTIGAAIHPAPTDNYLSNLVIRPELRYDYSEAGNIDAGTDNDQWTAAVDAIFTF